MRYWILLAVCLAGLARAEIPASVPAVDLARYTGTWYEIAAFPMYFQRNCVGDTSANYRLRDDGEIAVTNRCRTREGFDEAHGRAWAVEGSGNGRLKVSFFWPFRSDYWIFGLDADYRWALVGNPNRKYLWILSRTPELPKPLLDEALSIARAKGFDLGQLKYTPHGEAVQAP